MMADALDDLTLRKLKPPTTGRLELSDRKVPGLKFRLNHTGHASWSIQVNIDGRKRRFTIGEYPAIGLAEARRRGEKLRVDGRDGLDPIEERRAKAKLAAAKSRSVSDAIEAYAEIHLRPNLRTALERERQLRSTLAGKLGSPVTELTTSYLQAAIDQKAKDGSRFAANRIRAALMAFTAWCWRRGYIGDNIGLATTKVAVERPRDRLMSVDEVRLIYGRSESLGPLWGPFVRLLVLTAQRRGDVAGMRWSEVDLSARRWSIPARRTKNQRPHIVHLSDPALEELEALNAMKSAETGANADIDSDLVFTTTGKTSISGFGRTKERLDKLVGLADWRFHDLRTAFASALCDRGEPEGVVDRVLNHAASGSAPSAVARVYNQSEYLPQRARALDAWASLIAKARNE